MSWKQLRKAVQQEGGGPLGQQLEIAVAEQGRSPCLELGCLKLQFHSSALMRHDPGALALKGGCQVLLKIREQECWTG